MTKKLLLAATLFLATSAAHSQRLMHSLGVTVSILSGKTNTPALKANWSIQQTTFCYSPRFNFVEGENSAVSVSAPVGIGIGMASNSTRDDAGIALAYDLPLMLDYNIGCKANNETESMFGGFVGAGYGYYKVNISGSRYSDFTGSSLGPIFRGGIRFKTRTGDWGKKACTIDFFYKPDSKNKSLKTFGSHVLVDL